MGETMARDTQSPSPRHSRQSRPEPRSRQPQPDHWAMDDQPRPQPDSRRSRRQQPEAAPRRPRQEPASSPRARQAPPETPPLNHEVERIRKWLSQLRFRKSLFGGVPEPEVWKKIAELNTLYEAALSAERARYDALLQAAGQTPAPASPRGGDDLGF